MKAILAAILIAPCAATTFTPCPRPIDAPPIRYRSSTRRRLALNAHAEQQRRLTPRF